MTTSLLAKAKTSALLPLAMGSSLLQTGCSPFTKNGEISENSILFLVGMLAVSFTGCVGDILRNHAKAARIAEHNAAVEKLARLEAEAAENSEPIFIEASPKPQEKAKTLSWVEKPDAKKHSADTYKSWHDVPGMAKTNSNWRSENKPGRDAPEIPNVRFKTWGEATGGRRFTNSFGNDSPKPYYRTITDAVAQRNGTPAKILWR
ncbi:MAG: hypothetical protein WCT52_01935 [Candidatus Micrarchaeia archaeon]